MTKTFLFFSVLVAGTPVWGQEGCFGEFLPDGTFLDCPSTQASITAGVARLHKLDPACPAPTRKDAAGQCVLDNDVTLTETLMLTSFTHLNCKGHELRPATVGTADNPATTINEYRPSEPEVAILLNQAYGVKIQNCVIESFDFGVVIINGKIPSDTRDEPGAVALLRNKILSNEMKVRIQGVLLLGADNNQISDNRISYTSGGGKGIVVLRDSDQNHIAGNFISSPGNPVEFARQLPGSSAIGTLCADCGIITLDPPRQPLFNFQVGNTLIQFPNLLGTTNDNNVIEDNVVALPGSSFGKNHFGLTAAVRSRQTIIRANTVSGAGVGIVAAGFPINTPGLFPGRCSLDAGRFCATDADCQIPGVDGTSKGNCSGTVEQVFDARARNSLIEGNTVIGPFSSAAISGRSTLDLVIQGNGITGTGTENGITLFSDALETAIVTRNIIRGASVGLFLDHRGATRFGAKVSLNDITASTGRAVSTAPGYLFFTELSVSGRGNYWGHTCQEGGFLPDDSPNPTLVKDSHPYGQPVAAVPETLLPATCQ